MIVSLIAARSRNGVIGVEGGLPWRLPEDLKRFKALTMGKPLIVGRKTYESIGRPLPGRRMIVLSRSSAAIAGCQLASTLEEALLLAEGEAEATVGGGAEVYRLFLPCATRQYLTEVDLEVAGDTYYPPFGTEWRQVEEQPGTGCSYHLWQPQGEHFGAYFERFSWSPLEGRPGSYELREGELTDCGTTKFPEPVQLTRFAAGGGLISTLRGDGQVTHTLHTPDGLAREIGRLAL